MGEEEVVQGYVWCREDGVCFARVYPIFAPPTQYAGPQDLRSYGVGDVRHYGVASEMSFVIPTVNLPPSIPIPIADFSYLLLADRMVQFTNQTLNTASSYEWDFGDGTRSYLVNPTHVYSTNGDYAVTLIAKNSSGQNATEQLISIFYLEPKADFTYTVSGLKVFFKDKSTVLGICYWEFGDGGKTNTPNPIYRYDGNGEYNVTLMKGGYSKTIRITVYTEIQLEWDDNSTNEDGFKIEHSPNGVDWTNLATVGVNINSYGVTKAVDNVDSQLVNYFRVKAYNGVGESGYTNIASVQCSL